VSVEKTLLKLTDDLFVPLSEGKERPVRPSVVLKDWHPPSDDPKLSVNIVAPNGGGKSVFPTVLCRLDPHVYWVTGETGKKIITVLPTLGWATVGYYRTKCGGCDSIDKNLIFEAMYRLCESNLHFVMEGSIVSNTKNTYYDAFVGIQEKFPARRTLFCILDFSYETFLSRVMARNGGKEIKESCLQQKFNNITRYKTAYAQAGKVPLHIDQTEGVKAMFLSLLAAMNTRLGSNSLPNVEL
jgi:hypothetical protein